LGNSVHVLRALNDSL